MGQGLRSVAIVYQPTERLERSFDDTFDCVRNALIHAD